MLNYNFLNQNKFDDDGDDDDDDDDDDNNKTAVTGNKHSVPSRGCIAYSLNDLLLFSFLADINENGLPAGGVSKVHVQTIEHSQGPVDGSLYATVNKRKLDSHVTPPSSSVFQNGPTHLQNGSITSSLDSGISSTSGFHGDCMSFIYCFLG